MTALNTATQVRRPCLLFVRRVLKQNTLSQKPPLETNKTALSHRYAYRHRVFHEGVIDGFSTYFARYPEERITIVVLSNLFLSPVAKIVKALAAIVFGEPNRLSE